MKALGQLCALLAAEGAPPERRSWAVSLACDAVILADRPDLHAALVAEFAGAEATEPAHDLGPRSHRIWAAAHAGQLGALPCNGTWTKSVLAL